MPRRKAPDNRQRSNSPDLGIVDAKVTLITPPAPHPANRKLLKQTVDAWGEFWASELAHLVNRSDRPALARLFRMYDTRERLERIFDKSPFVPGSTGQITAHPAAKEIASLDGRILAIEDRFGITPMARLKLGVTFGAAARSLEDLNRGFNDDEEAGEESSGQEVAGDPRRGAIETTAKG